MAQRKQPKKQRKALLTITQVLAEKEQEKSVEKIKNGRQSQKTQQSETIKKLADASIQYKGKIIEIKNSRISIKGFTLVGFASVDKAKQMIDSMTSKV